MRILTLSMALVLALTGAAQAGSKKEIEKPPFDETIARQMIDNSIQRLAALLDQLLNCRFIRCKCLQSCRRTST